MKNGLNFHIQNAQDLGPLPASEKMSRMALFIEISAAQKADQCRYFEDLANPASPQRQLTSEQYAERFGLSASHRARITAWLESMGFSVDDSLEGRERAMLVPFNGTAGQVRAAFRTEIHRYGSFKETHFANAANPSIPSVLEAMRS